MKRRLLIIGASGHGKVVADIARLNDYLEVYFLDDNARIKDCNGCPVIGKSTDAETLNASQISDFFVAIGNAVIRENIMNRLANFNVISLIHPSAVVAEDVHIGIGTVVMAGAVINPGTIIGKGCIINTGATIDHDNTIADFVHISVGAHLAGKVEINKSTWVGIGTVISNNIRICEEVILGAGTVVIKNIEKSGTYVGTPARRIDKEN